MERLTIAECRKFIEASFDKAAEMGTPVSTAVVGPEGNLIAIERMDDAGFITPELAWGKAYTACAWRAISPRFSDGLVIKKWVEERNPQMMINASVFTGGRIVVSGGCAPVFKGNVMVGAYAVSGATSDQDEIIALHARETAGWRHKPEKDTTPQSVKDHINELYAKAGIVGRDL